MAIPVWTVQVDWNNNGSFTDTGDDISGRTLDTATMTMQYGRDQARALAPVAPGRAGFEIDNVSRDYSPDNGASPLSPNVLPARPVNITAVQNSVTYVMYRGFFDTYDISSQDHTASVACIDGIGRFQNLSLSTPLYQGIRTGTAIGLILDALGWPGGLRDLDPGATIIRWWWEEGTNGLTALQNLLVSEGPPALAFIDAQTGNFVFRDRHHRLTRTASKTSQATWNDSGAEPVFSAPFTYDWGARDIINNVSISVGQRDPAGVPSVVWQYSSAGTTTLTSGLPGSNQANVSTGSGVIIVPAAGSVSIDAQTSDPFIGAVPPDPAYPDYTIAAGDVAATLSRTSGQSTTITLTSTAGASVAGLQLRAYPVTVTQTTQISQADATSITLNGDCALPSGTSPVWAGANDAIAIAQLILNVRAKRLPVIQVTFDGIANTTVLTQQLARDLSDRVTVTEFETALSSVDFFIEQIQHAVTAGGARLVTTFGCEKAPATVAPFVFDDAALGKFNTGGVLGL